jgi:hypothetical protein
LRKTANQASRLDFCKACLFDKNIKSGIILISQIERIIEKFALNPKILIKGRKNEKRKN